MCAVAHIHAVAQAYVETLVRHAATVGQRHYGTRPVPTDLLAYCSGACAALERIGALTPAEAHDALTRCHDAYGVRRPPDIDDGKAWATYVPEWAEERPPDPWDAPPAP